MVQWLSFPDFSPHYKRGKKGFTAREVALLTILHGDHRCTYVPLHFLGRASALNPQCRTQSLCNGRGLWGAPPMGFPLPMGEWGRKGFLSYPARESLTALEMRPKMGWADGTLGRHRPVVSNVHKTLSPVSQGLGTQEKGP